jgi:hypothetical protein
VRTPKHFGYSVNAECLFKFLIRGLRYLPVYQPLDNLFKKVLAYSIHGFWLIKLEWDDKEEKFNSYFDILDKPYTPTSEDLEYISSILETKVEVTYNATSKDITRLLMTKDEFDFTSAYYYSIKKMPAQEELQKLSSFIEKHHIQQTASIEKDIQDLKDKIRYYEAKSIIGGNK